MLVCQPNILILTLKTADINILFSNSSGSISILFHISIDL